MTMSKHDLPLDANPIHEWMNSVEQEYCGEYGGGYKRKLCIAVGRQEFIVYDHGEVVHRGMQPFPAILAYNNIKPR